MKIAPIQNQPNIYQTNRVPQKATQLNGITLNQTSFKGGNGALVGTGVGVIAALLTVVTAGAALPVLFGTAAIIGGGAGGAYVGNKVGDIISPDKKNKK